SWLRCGSEASAPCTSAPPLHTQPKRRGFFSSQGISDTWAEGKVCPRVSRGERAMDFGVPLIARPALWDTLRRSRGGFLPLGIPPLEAPARPGLLLFVAGSADTGDLTVRDDPLLFD